MKDEEPAPQPVRLDEVRHRIEHLAYHDSLTELPNRLLLRDRLAIALSRTVRARRLVAVLFLDLDRFKPINDRLGHAHGDLLLREFGARLRGLMRNGDTLARLGGDEFVVVLPDLHRLEDVIRVVSKIQAAIRGPFLLEGGVSHHGEHRSERCPQRRTGWRPFDQKCGCGDVQSEGKGPRRFRILHARSQCPRV